MSRRRIAALALSGALLAGGTTAAIAAVTKDDPKKTEDAILADAAKRLNVTPDKLRDALSAAQDAQSTRRSRPASSPEAGRPRSRSAASRPASCSATGSFPGARRCICASARTRSRGCAAAPTSARTSCAAASSPTSPRRSGSRPRSCATGCAPARASPSLAKSKGKTLDDVRTALKADAKTAADKAVKDGDLTRDQADKMLEGLDEMLEHLGDERVFKRGLSPPRRRPPT